MALLLDIGVIALVVLFAIGGYKKGLLISVVNVFGTILACAISPVLGSMFSPLIYDSFIKSTIMNSVNKAMENLPADISNVEKAAAIIEKLPNSVANMLSIPGIHTDKLALDMSTTTLSVSELVEGSIRPYAQRLVSTVLTVILFILISMGLKFAAHFATKVVEAVKLGNVNKTFGGVFGIAESAFIIMMVTLLIYFSSMFLSPESYEYVNQSISETVIYKFIYEYSMPDKILSMLMLK